MRGFIHNLSVETTLNAPVPSLVDVPVFLMIGQSNLLRGTVSLHPNPPSYLTSVSDNVLLYQGDTFSFEAMNPSVNNLGTYGETGKFGPEVSFGVSIASHLATSVYILKLGKGSTTMATDWNEPSGSLYVELLAQIDEVTVTLTALGFNPDWKGLMIMQGENDAVTQTDADAYQTNLGDFVTGVRTKVGDLTLPVVIARVNGVNDPSMVYRATVRTAQENWANGDSYARWFDTDSYGFNDVVHYDEEGYISLGNDFYAQYILI